MEADFVRFYDSKSGHHWANILSSKPLAKQNYNQFNLKLSAFVIEMLESTHMFICDELIYFLLVLL